MFTVERPSLYLRIVFFRNINLLEVEILVGNASATMVVSGLNVCGCQSIFSVNISLPFNSNDWRLCTIDCTHINKQVLWFIVSLCSGSVFCMFFSILTKAIYFLFCLILLFKRVVSLVLSREIGWEDRLRPIFCLVELKTSTQYIILCE